MKYLTSKIAQPSSLNHAFVTLEFEVIFLSESKPEIAFEILQEAARKQAKLPGKLAELSYHQPEEALRLLRKWGEGKQPLKSLFEEVTDLLDKGRRQD